MSAVWHKLRSFKREKVAWLQSGKLHAHHPFRCPGRSSPVDAFQQHRELRAAQRDRSTGRPRPHKTSPLQPLGQQAQAVAVEPQHLHDVAAPATENEYVARQGLLFQHRLHLRAEPMKAAPHVSHPGRDPYPRVHWKVRHPRRLASTARTIVGSTLPSKRIRTAPGSSTWIAPALTEVPATRAGFTASSSPTTRTGSSFIPLSGAPPRWPSRYNRRH